ncbi:hypothetical protein Tel_16010 [Candidatus Tenderia electrophaga]|uniref:Uncharacterized protein n=1 Tax=Candidatus Tenderia electrophaga TaxID=1748243 RepID=A0A0S2THB2_9GAMM|nr:hypothetical protein Tel_16010 [Candidatus Tenderia electrophaga]
MSTAFNDPGVERDIDDQHAKPQRDLQGAGEMGGIDDGREIMFDKALFILGRPAHAPQPVFQGC